tara:strand:- start:99 stop:311 length:213 start_codon:yes stop_codon:yes gene_type:complete
VRCVADGDLPSGVAVLMLDWPVATVCAGWVAIWLPVRMPNLQVGVDLATVRSSRWRAAGKWQMCSAIWQQ